MEKEQSDLLAEQLEEANRNFDKILPQIWKQAEDNLKQMEADYLKEQGEKSS
ncbi:hypothetical protein D3C74_324840 [compost metagenome]